MVVQSTRSGGPERALGPAVFVEARRSDLPKHGGRLEGGGECSGRENGLKLACKFLLLVVGSI